MKKSTQIYLALTLIGVILIGLGCGISIFEISNYKTADYRTNFSDAALPMVEITTETLEAPLSGSGQFKLDYYPWYDSDYDVQIDNSLQDKVLVQITGPKGLYNYHLTKVTQENSNYYQLYLEGRDLESFQLMLKAAKEGYIINNLPPVKVTLLMSEAQAKNFKLNEERNRASEMASDYEERMQTMEEQYQEQLIELEEQRQTQWEEQQQSYETRINELQQQYEEQLMEKEEQIEMLQQQIEDIRSSLN